MGKPKPFRIALYTTYYAAGDGMGRVLMYKIAALDQLAETQPVELRVFCGGSDFDDPRVTIVDKVPAITGDPFFQAADFHHYEFGWYFRPFETIRHLPPKARSSVFFHGITPPQWASNSEGAVQSLKQRRLLFRTDAICVASPFARDDLLSFGIREDRIGIHPLPLSLSPRERQPVLNPEVIELIHVARLSPNKGLFDLLQALEIESERGLSFRLRIAAHPASATPSYLAELQRRIDSPAIRGRVQILGHLDDTALSALYAEADAIVLPTYHDTYCLPVLEAFAHGCHVIAYDSSNLPHITNGLASLVPTGDVPALADAIGRFAAELSSSGRTDAMITTSSGPVTLDEHHLHMTNYARGFTAENFKRGFLKHVDGVLAAPKVRPGVFARLRTAMARA